MHQFVNGVADGDVVVAWDAERRAVVAILEVVGRKTSRRGHRIELQVVERPHDVFLNALKHTTRPQLGGIRALQPGASKPVYRLSTTDAAEILRACESRLVRGFRDLAEDERALGATRVI